MILFVELRGIVAQSAAGHQGGSCGFGKQETLDFFRQRRLATERLVEQTCRLGLACCPSEEQVLARACASPLSSGGFFSARTAGSGLSSATAIRH